MFEREIYSDNHSNQDDCSLSEKFCSPNKDFTHKTTLNWSEHCSECTMPSCFSTCGFYTPRPDFKCNRFKGGISFQQDRNKTILDITFKKWGKLEASGHFKMSSKNSFLFFEKLDRFVNSTIKLLPLSLDFKNRVRNKLYKFKNSKDRGEHIVTSDAFLVEVANPSNIEQALNLTIRNKDGNSSFFQKRIILAAGYQKIVIPIDEITKYVQLNKDYICSLEPLDNDSPNGQRVLFGVIDFVVFSKSIENTNIDKAKTAKCVVWDLDNTLWSGVLVEDGKQNLSLNKVAIQLIKEFDKKGILNSISSKNNFDTAMDVINEAGLAEYFLYPQINWGPKSNSIKNIQNSLNIGMDTIVFIDDQVFERSEVASKYPEVRTFDILDINNWKSDAIFNVEISSESSKRRVMYQNEISRNNVFLEQDNADYKSFLRDCNIKVKIEKLSSQTVKRASELAQRTNQMNFSGTRYTTDQIYKILNDESKIANIIKVSDKFGDYGIVGLSVFNIGNNVLEDLMFSCRIQSKYVDHAVIIELINKFGSDLKIEFKPSEKNSKSSKIFSELGFTEVDIQGAKSILKRKESSRAVANDIVEVKYV